MTKLTLVCLFLSIASFSAQAGERKAELPVGLRCESVKQSSILDLPGFCQGALDKRRLVDYGYQLDILEACGENILSKSLKSALQSKVYREDVRSCTEIAEGLVRDLSLSGQR